jgi:hypothetical protein
MSSRIIIAALTGAVLSAGCSLNWDGPRPLAPADARLDGPAADAGPAADQATPDAETDMYWQDLPWSDAQKDAAPPDAAADAASDLTADLPTCPYAYSAHAQPADSVKNLNVKVGQSWSPVGFPHATADHAAWLVSGKTYELIGKADGAALESAVDAKLKSGKVYTVVAFLANKGTAVWMEQSGLYKFAKDAAAVNNLAKKSWNVHAYLRHTGQTHATWMQKGNDYKLLQDNYASDLSKAVRAEFKDSWVPTKGLSNGLGYAFWVYSAGKSHYKLYSQSGIVNINLFLNTFSTGGWTLDVVHALSPHAVWVSQANHLMIDVDGPGLAGKLNNYILSVKTAKVERFFAKQDNVVWLHKSCTP